MSRNWLIGVGVGLVATAALVTVGVTAYELGERETEQVVVTGTESVGGRIIVDHDGWRHGPGPGFLILPLLIVGGIFLLSSRRRRGWCGPGYRSGPWGPGPRRDHHDRYWDERPIPSATTGSATTGSATADRSGRSTRRRRRPRPRRRRPRRIRRLPRIRRRDSMRVMTHVLVVDDEPAIVDIVTDYLADAGYRVSVARTGDDALRQVRSIIPDLVVLDLGLPGVDGLDVAREIRRTSAVPIIMLTARSDEADRVAGLELGADDYVVKPFSPRELLARVRAVLRRGAVRDDGGAFAVGDLIVNPAERTVEVGGASIDLTATEFDLLAALATSPGRVFTRTQLLETVHGVAVDAGERAIDAHVKNLRRKLETEPHRPRRLLTVHGVGYRLVAP